MYWRGYAPAEFYREELVRPEPSRPRAAGEVLPKLSDSLKNPPPPRKKEEKAVFRGEWVRCVCPITEEMRVELDGIQGGVRGLIVELGRKGKAKEGTLYIIVHERQTEDALPPAFDVVPVLERCWGCRNLKVKARTLNLHTDQDQAADNLAEGEIPPDVSAG